MLGQSYNNWPFTSEATLKDLHKHMNQQNIKQKTQQSKLQWKYVSTVGSIQCNVDNSDACSSLPKVRAPLIGQIIGEKDSGSVYMWIQKDLTKP